MRILLFFFFSLFSFKRVNHTLMSVYRSSTKCGYVFYCYAPECQSQLTHFTWYTKLNTHRYTLTETWIIHIEKKEKNAAIMSESTTTCFFAKVLYSLTKVNAFSLIRSIQENHSKLFSTLQNSSFVLATAAALLLGLVSVWYLYRSKNRKQFTEKVGVVHNDTWKKSMKGRG